MRASATRTAEQNEYAFVNYGFTNDRKHFDAAMAFLAAAKADGWTGGDSDHEREQGYYKLSLPPGWVMHVTARDHTKDPTHAYEYEAQVSIWGPDGLVILAPVAYDMKVMQENLRRCNLCQQPDRETQRYSFAGRCCADCLQDARKKHEYPGWCD